MIEIESRLKDYGFFRPRLLKREIKTNRCMADNDCSVVIVPNGHIGKCEHYTEDHFVSHIGSNNWDVQMQEAFFSTRDEIDACATCYDYPNCIWLRLCEDVPHCYHEERQYKLSKLRQSILKAYQQTKKEQEDEVQD